MKFDSKTLGRWTVLVNCVLMFLLLSAQARAARQDQHIERDGRGWLQEITGSLSRDKALQVAHFVGSVRVVSGAKSGNYVLRLHSMEPDESEARKQFASFHLATGRKGGETLLQMSGPIDLGIRAELLIQLPSATEAVYVDTLAGKISIHGRVPRLELQTHGGDIELDDADLLRARTMGGSVIVNHRLGDSFIRTDGGDIKVDASVGDLQILSLGGNISLKAIAKGRVQSGGGNIDVIRCTGPLLVTTAGGNISLGEMDGSVRAETGGGTIRIGIAHGMVVANTALGDIELWKLSQGVEAHTGMGRITAEFIGDRNAMHDSELVTSMGDIVVYFGAAVPGTVHAVTGASPTRRIINEFPDIRISNGSYGPHSISAEGPIHGGGPSIEVRTMIGRIELRNSR